MGKRPILVTLVAVLILATLSVFMAGQPAFAQDSTPVTENLGDYLLDPPLYSWGSMQTTHWEDVWDLTKGDVTLTFTLDMTGIIQPAEWPMGYYWDGDSWEFDNTPTTDPAKYPDTYTPWVEVGMRGVGGGDYNPGPANTYQGKCGGWLVAESDDWLGARDENGVLINDGQDTQDGDDKLSLAATSNVGEWHYDVLDGDGIYGFDSAWNTVISDPAWEQAYTFNYEGKNRPGFGNHWNHGLWYDRDGVDQWQANSWGNSGENIGRINTGGIYHVEITYHAIDNGLGVMFATINGVKQGFFQADPVTGAINWGAPPTLYPAGLSFKGDMKQMQVFAGIYAFNDPVGHDYGSVQLSNIQVTGIPGVADPLIPSFTATVGAGNVVTFDASATHGGMAPYTYHWDFDADGVVDKTSSVPEETYTFPGPGDYPVLLMVDPFRCEPVAYSQTITIVPPMANLAIVKSGPIWANVGDTLSYTYDVTNAGPASAAPIVSDDKCGVPTYTGGDANANGLVDPDETWQFTCAYTPNPKDVKAYMTLTNTATVMPDGVEDSDLSDNADTYSLVWTVLRKDVLLYWQGHNVGYSDPNTEFTFEMWKDGALLGTFSIKESAPVYFWLSEGPYIFKEVNVPAGYTPARTQWSWTILAGKHYDMSFENLIRFDLAVEKTGPTGCVAPDSTITYSYKVTNAGPAAVTPILWDDNATPADPADDYQPMYASGDTNGDGKIQPDEVWFYTADYVMPMVTVNTNIVNTVTVKDAEDDYGDGWKLGGDTDLTNNTDTWSTCVSWYGFTPGYWKNHPKIWAKKTDYSTTMKVMDVFTIPTELLELNKSGVYVLDLNNDKKSLNDSLMDALKYKGGSDLSGKAQILLRAATASLLNESALGDYFPPYDSVQGLIDAVNATLATLDPAQYSEMANLLDYWNNGVHQFP